MLSIYGELEIIQSEKSRKQSEKSGDHWISHEFYMWEQNPRNDRYLQFRVLAQQTHDFDIFRDFSQYYLVTSQKLNHEATISYA